MLSRLARSASPARVATVALAGAAGLAALRLLYAVVRDDAAGLAALRLLHAVVRGGVEGPAGIPRPPNTGRRLRLCLLNPQDGSEYNVRAREMIAQLFALAGVDVDLEEVDAMCADSLAAAVATAYDGYDGYIIPGSLASAYDDDPWIIRLADAVRRLHARGSRIFGICFGAQIVARAHGGTVCSNPAGARVALGSVEVTSFGAAHGFGSGSLQYSHGDVVCALPDMAVAACTAWSSQDVAVYYADSGAAEAAVLSPRPMYGPHWPTGAEVRARFATPDPRLSLEEELEAQENLLIVSLRSGVNPHRQTVDDRGCYADALAPQPLAVAMQAHPEFSTPTGSGVLRRILRRYFAKRDDLDERLASARRPTDAVAMTRAAVALLWPQALRVVIRRGGGVETGRIS